jgi:hypothetical protein
MTVLRDVNLSEQVRGVRATWRLLGPEQRVAAVGVLLLIVSTFGPFSFVEAAEILTGLGLLLLLKRRADGYEFHLPFGDGTVIAAAGVWSGILILVRLFDRPLGQNLLALACAALVFAAGIRERAKRPMDDMHETRRMADTGERIDLRVPAPAPTGEPTVRLPAGSEGHTVPVSAPAPGLADEEASPRLFDPLEGD